MCNPVSDNAFQEIQKVKLGNENDRQLFLTSVPTKPQETLMYEPRRRNSSGSGNDIGQQPIF